MDYIWSTFIQAKKFNGGRTLIKLEYIGYIKIEKLNGKDTFIKLHKNIPLHADNQQPEQLPQLLSQLDELYLSPLQQLT